MYLQNKLITLNEAINMEKDNIKKLHKEYMNSSLVFLLSALNFDIKSKRYFCLGRKRTQVLRFFRRLRLIKYRTQSPIRYRSNK